VSDCVSDDTPVVAVVADVAFGSIAAGAVVSVVAVGVDDLPLLLSVDDCECVSECVSECVWEEWVVTVCAGGVVQQIGRNGWSGYCSCSKKRENNEQYGCE
jgi:hypothetical protein